MTEKNVFDFLKEVAKADNIKTLENIYNEFESVYKKREHDAPRSEVNEIGKEIAMISQEVASKELDLADKDALGRVYDYNSYVLSAETSEESAKRVSKVMPKVDQMHKNSEIGSTTYNRFKDNWKGHTEALQRREKVSAVIATKNVANEMINKAGGLSTKTPDINAKTINKDDR